MRVLHKIFFYTNTSIYISPLESCKPVHSIHVYHFIFIYSLSIYKQQYTSIRALTYIQKESFNLSSLFRICLLSVYIFIMHAYMHKPEI